jgi:GT2 family glycosyltransferase/glycosyltransferase involved in cell wall biosynthesis
VTRLLVVTPWIPGYNVPFYDRLEVALAHHEVRLVVTRNGAPPSMARRGDLSGGRWARDVPTSWVTVGGREIPFRRISSVMRQYHPDLVVVEQALHNPETYPLLVRHAMGRFGVAMWGQGRSYSTTQSAVGATIKQWLTRRGDWFFAYTQAGADHVVRHGFSRTRVSVLNNTIDTERLRSDLDAVDPQELDGFRREHGLTPGKTALFLGGVDQKKGIDFLLESARVAGELMPGFVLLIAGEGDSLPTAQAGQAGGVPVRLLGRVDGHAKALALRAADVLAIPEWIGLVAVDALVSGRPVITTDHPSHSPEHEYLVPGETSVVAAHTAADYARAVVSTLSATDRLAAMQAAARLASHEYTLDAMVDSFVEGVLGWRDLRRAGLSTGTRRGRVPAPTDPATHHGITVTHHGIPARDESGHEKRALAVLMTCHNRRERTVRCLEALRAQDLPDVEARVYLTDDGSSDGTAAAIAGVDLSVKVIAGDGQLYWAAGMAMAERSAMEDDPDLLLWLNDDVTLDPDALTRLLTVHEQTPDAIVVGNVRDRDTGDKTYGGRSRLGRHPQRFRPVPSAGEVQQVSAFNGNVVLVPRGVRRLVGPIDGLFAHAYADDDYGMRASKLGVAILCAAETVGICRANPAGAWPTGGPTGVRAAWKQLQDPTRLPWRSQVRYLRRHGGPLWPAYLAWGYGKAIMRAGAGER